MVAIGSNLGAVVGAEEEPIESIPGKKEESPGIPKGGRREMKPCWKQF